ncbi:MAG: Rrf2 family transcriptional regulator [Opitutae bacterium]|jgi:Rrf2 family transcriptional regulator, nitric oxide-sensitive transcriptional repressor|nr:Rrf2 family transcriptional regulator [Opitutae bacterium]
MELSQFTDYSLRTLIFVALAEEELSSVKQIATAYGISRNHLVKVVHNLARNGYLKTFKGKGGGIKLAMPPEDINIGKLMRVTENLAILECIPLKRKKVGCCIAGICELQVILRKALNAFLAELDDVTLSDLLSRKSAMQKRLGIS